MRITESTRPADGNDQPVATGLIAGTLVEGPNGWLPVENLRIGDLLHSYDGGLTRVLGIDRKWTTPKSGAFGLHVPGGALDNCSDMILLPEQLLLIDTLNDPHFPDANVVLIPARALTGWFGISKLHTGKAVEVITPRFADDEVIYANSGTRLHCTGIRQVAEQPASDFFTVLDLTEAQFFLRRFFGASTEQPLREAA